MMKKVLIGMISVAGVMLVTSCADTFNPGGNSDQKGRILPSVTLDNSVVTSKSSSKAPVSRAADAVTADQMQIRLTRDAGGYDKTWTSLADFPVGETFAVGDYTFSAFYGDPEDQGVGKPYYYGETKLTVEENHPAEVQVVAQLANSMLTITYSEAFKSYFTSYATTLTTPLGDLAIDPESDAPVYLPAGEVSFTIKVTKPTGSEVTLTPGSVTTQARHHYFVQFDLNNGNVDSPVLEITWDENLDEEIVEIDLSEDIINAPKPTLTAEGFPIESFIAGHAPEGARNVTAIAHGGLSAIVMTTTSASLIEQGWPAEVDLMAGDAATDAATAALGLSARGLSKSNKFAQITLTSVLDHIKYVEGADNTTEFTFVAKDIYNKESEPLTLSVDIEKLILTLSNPAPVVKGQTDFSCQLDYNGGDPSHDLTLQLKNERGTWSNVEATYTPASRAIGSYLVELTIDGERDTQLRALTADGVVSEPLNVVHADAPHALTIDDRDSYAHSAKVTLIDNPAYNASRGARKTPAEMAASGELMISTDGKIYKKVSNATLNGTTWTVNGLEAGKTYYFRATVDELPSVAQKATTEMEEAIPDGNLDFDWETLSSGKYWEFVKPFGSWDTLNGRTTSQKNGTDGTTYSYVCISGTIKTNDAHSGSAALVRTVGWGRGNTAAVFSGMGTCKHVTAGELYLGTFNSANVDADPAYGIEFTSRPKSVSFWYKYAKKADADQGYMEVTLYDASGNVIFTDNKVLTATAYTQETITFNYPATCEKAAKMSIIFRSSNQDVANNINATWLTPPPARNLGTGTYMGSQLYVDEIEAVY